MHLTDDTLTIYAVRGDTGDARRVVLGGDEDLTQANTFIGHVQRLGIRANLTATLLDADERITLVSLDPWLADATPGSWALEVTVEWGTTQITYPSAHEDRVSVRVRADYG